MLLVTERIEAGPGVARDTHQKFLIILRKLGLIREQVGGPPGEAPLDERLRRDLSTMGLFPCAFYRIGRTIADGRAGIARSTRASVVDEMPPFDHILAAGRKKME